LEKSQNLCRKGGWEEEKKEKKKIIIKQTTIKVIERPFKKYNLRY